MPAIKKMKKARTQKPREVRLRDLARVIRSKNAGPFTLTLDVLFRTPEAYEQVKKSGVISVETMSKLYHIPPEKLEIIYYPAGLAIKVVMPRTIVSGDVDDTDVYGAQQHTPLLDLMVPAGKSN